MLTTMVATRAGIAALRAPCVAGPRAAAPWACVMRLHRGAVPTVSPAVRLRGFPARAASTAAAPRPGRGVSIKAGVLFAGLSALALVFTSYGVWEYFSAFRVWPKELREPLRAALKARNRGKLNRSAKHFREALDLARTLDPSRLGDDILLKTTGIAIALADVLEQDNRMQEAAHTYLDALDEVLQRGAYAHAAPAVRTPQERMRGVALAQKIGDMASHGVTLPPLDMGETLQTEDPAEGYLSWSVSELLRLVQAQERTGASPVMLADLHLPPWVDTQEVGGSIEALGAFYARHDVAEYAVPLYLQAITLLLPPKHTGRAPPTVADRCRAAVLMNNISQVLAQGKRPPLPSDAPHPSVAPLDQAVAWAAKGLDLATITNYRAGFLSELPAEEQQWLLHFNRLDPHKVGPVAQQVEAQSAARLEQVKSQCLGVQFVLLYNLGMFHEMRGEKLTARTLFVRAARHADALGLREARTQCARSIRRLDRS